MLNEMQKNLLKEVAGLEQIPEGAYNIRRDGESVGRSSTANISIVSKKDKPGIDIIIEPNTKNERVDIPVLLTKTGFTDLVYNDFYIGENADVVIVAGCGIHNPGKEQARHDGIHAFHVGKNARVKYVEKHYGEGEGSGERILNPQTIIEIDEGGYMEMETAQIKGVDSSIRETKAVVGKKGALVVHEKIMTHGKQLAETKFDLLLDGDDAHAHIVSRAVAKDTSRQSYSSKMIGKSRCNGRTECDAILMDEAVVIAKPEIEAKNLEASLVHEAAIGKIAGEQLIKLMSLGLDEKAAEELIINGFLK